MLHEVSRRAREHWDELVELLTLEQGKPVPENEEEMEWTADTFDYYAELGRHIRGRVVPSGEPETQLNMVLKEPYGVVAAIIPWNYPMLLMAWKVAAALAAGNTVVIKPSELTPLTTLLFVEKCMSHLPPGVVNVVTGYGQPVGEALVKHPDVPVIAFTGSLATGQRISTLAAPMIKRLHLVWRQGCVRRGPDIDVESTAKALAYPRCLTPGRSARRASVYVAGNVAGQLSRRW